MKKILVTLLAAVTLLFTGCEPSENAIVATANTAGTIAVLGWFSIDDPDPEVKTVLKKVVTKISTATVAVGEGKTYLEVVLPEINEFVDKQEKLNGAQKALIKSGSIIVLNGIDTFFATNEKVKTNVDLANKVVNAFCTGAQAGLRLAEDSKEVLKAKSVYQKRVAARGGRP